MRVRRTQDGRYAALLMGLAAGAVLLAPTTPSGVAAQDEAGRVVDVVNVVALACPSVDVAPDACEPLEGVTVELLVGGIPAAGGPTVTRSLRPGGIVAGFGFPDGFPSGAELTIRQTGGIPAGYTPAAGYDPLVVSADDLDLVPLEIGPEPFDRYPYAYVVNVPVGDEDRAGREDTDDPDDPNDNGGVARLPDTGTGPGTGTGVTTPTDGVPAWLALLIAAIAVMAGVGARRQDVR